MVIGEKPDYMHAIYN